MSNIAKRYFELQCLRQEVYDAEQELHLATLPGSKTSAHLCALERLDPTTVASLGRGSETSRGGPTHH